MKIVIFCHSLLSDWNHGNAHFLRGVSSELVARGHDVVTYEPREGWSVQNLISELGDLPLGQLRARYPRLDVVRYGAELDLDQALDGAALVLVHEWNSRELVHALGRRRAQGARFRLLFHDTHHRSVSDQKAMAELDLSGYDAVLAFGEAVRERYVSAGWARSAFTWHEAADVRLFRPLAHTGDQAELIWVGNWGDEERTRELYEFVLEPVVALGVRAKAYGVRYPEHAMQALADAGIAFGGYVPNFKVPELYAAHRVTVHVPRRPYAESLPGIPTIRVFEALACGIPLVSAPWRDVEGLFRPDDFVMVDGSEAMKRALSTLLADPSQARALAERGLETILARHTCAHRAAELLQIAAALGTATPEFAAHALEAAGWD